MQTGKHADFQASQGTSRTAAAAVAGGQQEVSEDREGREDHHPRLVALPRDFIYIVYNTIGASAQLETAPAVDVVARRRRRRRRWRLDRC